MSAGAIDSTIRTQHCSSCSHSFPEDHECCPHCSQPHLFPNVVITQHADELAVLENRYTQALTNADIRKCRSIVDVFDEAVRQSNVVVCCTAAKLAPLATTHQQLYANFYDTEALYFTPARRTGEPDWNIIRPVGEIKLLGSNVNLGKLHYGVLSLTDTGIGSYGDYSIKLRESMVSHRTSIFQENSAVYCEANSGPIPKGMRSNWLERHKVCVAKLANLIDSVTKTTSFPGILLEEGTTSDSDKFVEAQIFGPMTVYTFEKVTKTGTKTAIGRGRRAASKAHQLAIRDMCASAGVEFK